MLVFAPFTLLPWPVFCWVLALAIGLSVPLIAWLCLRYFEPEPSTASLLVGTLLVLLVPAAWQNFALGQVGLFEILFMLLTDWALRSKRYGWAVLFGFFALLKPTCFIPLLFVLFVREDWRGRAALLGAAGVNLGVNLLGALMIGPKLFFDSYQTNSRQMALPNAPLDPMSGYRIDMNVLSASFLHGAALTAAGLLLTALLCGGYYRIEKRSSRVGLPNIAALSLLALLLVYHQAYDAVLLAPAMLYGYQLFRTGRLRPTEWVYIGLLALCVLAFGNHNVVDLLLKPLHHVQPVYFRPLVLLAAYSVLLWQMDQTQRGNAGDSGDQTASISAA